MLVAQTGAAPAKNSAQGWKHAIPFLSRVSTTSFASQNVAARFRPAKLRGSLFAERMKAEAHGTDGAVNFGASLFAAFPTSMSGTIAHPGSIITR